MSTAATLRTDRLALELLTVEHAEEMVTALANPSLYEVIGGEPPTLDRLRERYTQQVAGSAMPGERWLNWIVRVRRTGLAVGYVQATVSTQEAAAELAWVIGMSWQGQGYATEAALSMVQELRRTGITTLVAHVRPGHLASERVARALGMISTGRHDDGEAEWRL